MNRTRAFFLSLLLLAGIAPASAQLAAKPSAFRAQGEHDPRPVAAETYRARIDSREAFDRLSRRYNIGTPLELPHVLFVIDREHGGALYFVNTRRFDLHQHFLARGPLQLKLDHAALAANYRSPQRRFLFGTLSWQATSAQWNFEFWEGDRLGAELLREAEATLQAGFYAPLLFKANARAQELAAQQAGIAFITQEALIREQAFLPLNTGVARGRIRVIREGGLTAELEPNDIAILDEVPMSLPPVAGVVTTRPSTAISHVNLLAKGWGIPNAWVRDALAVFEPLDRQWVELVVSRTGYQIRPIAPQRTDAKHAQQVLPPPQLSRRTLTPLAALRAADQMHCGAKAANLGAVKAARVTGVVVPDGFCIPFSHYADFINSDAARELIAQALQTPGFERDPLVRHAALASLRAALVKLPLPPQREEEWQARWQAQLKGVGVFVRSSSNSEDLPGFSGAGLYSTVPNVTRAEALPHAVKTVWASVYNSEAFEARRAAGIADNAVAMAVLVQVAVDARSAGVMITRDPFDPAHHGASYIAAKRGIGIKVVEGRNVAEQVMVDARSGAVQLLSHADESSELHLDAGGGVSERDSSDAAAQGNVLDDATARQLARVGSAVRHLFHGREQDIEWATTRAGEVVLLQARPYGPAALPGSRVR